MVFRAITTEYSQGTMDARRATALLLQRDASMDLLKLNISRLASLIQQSTAASPPGDGPINRQPDGRAHTSSRAEYPWATQPPPAEGDPHGHVVFQYKENNESHTGVGGSSGTSPPQESSPTTIFRSTLLICHGKTSAMLRRASKTANRCIGKMTTTGTSGVQTTPRFRSPACSNIYSQSIHMTGKSANMSTQMPQTTRILTKPRSNHSTKLASAT